MKKDSAQNDEKRKYLEAVGNRLFRYRTEARKTQFEIAEMAGISGRAYSEIERGESDMRITTLVSLSEALEVSADRILFEEAENDGARSLPAIFETVNRSDERTKRLIEAILEAFFRCRP